MEDFTAKEESLKDDLARYKRAYTRLQDDLETRRAEHASLVTRIATLSSVRVAAPSSTPTQQVYSDADEKTMVRALWQYNLTTTCVLKSLSPNIFSRFIFCFMSSMWSHNSHLI